MVEGTPRGAEPESDFAGITGAAGSRALSNIAPYISHRSFTVVLSFYAGNKHGFGHASCGLEQVIGWVREDVPGWDLFPSQICQWDYNRGR